MSGRLIGYARVSTDEQTHDPQVGELKTAKCDEIVLEYGSGANRERPKLAFAAPGRRRDPGGHPAGSLGAVPSSIFDDHRAA